uniref:Uncharacterized protein n=1 Tax=Microcebus murinus TaxID=30608 RepID=A0A8C5Y8R0_MICMU
MASWAVQKCCTFRHSHNILDEDLEVKSRQIQLRKTILTESNTRKQLAPLTT